MSPHTYSIKFNNRSGVENTWAFFVKPPQLSTTSSVGGLYSNVWISSFVPDGGWFDITTTDQVYACRSESDLSSMSSSETFSSLLNTIHEQGPGQLHRPSSQVWWFKVVMGP